jgi:antitoxin (DNA-binding transcriptional repressor) of toxin-antitoxin stability system
MDEPITATELRAKIYQVIDQVLATGEPREIVRNGQRLLLVPASRPRRDLERRPRRQATACTPDELVETRWDETWQPDL